MRNQFVELLEDWALEDPRVTLIVGDLGFGVVDDFSKKLPDQFINAGIAEQSMMTMAAGMASEGSRPFVYSIANFPTFRAAEQIRNDVAHHRLPVTVVAVGGGLVYGSLGYSHHAIQDYALMRAMPEMTILSPGDPREMSAVIRFLKSHATPAYLRIGSPSTPAVHERDVDVEPGRLLHVAGPRDAQRTLLTTGAVLNLANGWLKRPEYNGWALHSVPIWGAGYRDGVREDLQKYAEIVTVEDHLLDGGFGSWVLETFASSKHRPTVSIRALDPRVAEAVGKEDYLRVIGGLES
ncbi:transketolase family protein [Microbacterium sp. SORGH_AS_0888]|uniref:transketolase family protein n=1 Tax=Microbacterium sp. SORGH_AS_0888 TaxID=3041791 RepID=UPI00277F6E23|nr:transketolase [Microbacterium sp. SORGH_AS_0888]MDQ1127881.1 transketolase [Microbacterium sp. SORGH_AS_0888]